MTKMTKPEIRPILIAGGRGTRFWPLSRKKKPKPLLSLLSRVALLKISISGQIVPTLVVPS